MSNGENGETVVGLYSTISVLLYFSIQDQSDAV